MLELIKKAVYQYIKPDSITGLFFSLFDTQGTLMVSNGVVSTDKPAEQLIQIIYNGILSQHPAAKMIVCDIVTDLQEQEDSVKLLAYSPKEYGLAMSTIDGSKSGVILPDTSGVNDMKTALLSLKQKYQVTGNVTMYVFKTQRITIALS
jgi:hypothetical protein